MWRKTRSASSSASPSLPQRSNLDGSLKVREILTFHAAYHGIPKAEREARADELLDELGLADRKNDRVNSYSGGMNQRLMIARALMHSPDVLFLDEPTNNLDPQSRLFLWDRIRELNARGLTILITTHDMEEADRLCERIAVMDHGKILVDDTPDALKQMIPGGTSLELRVSAPELVPVGGVRTMRLGIACWMRCVRCPAWPRWMSSRLRPPRLLDRPPVARLGLAQVVTAVAAGEGAVVAHQRVGRSGGDDHPPLRRRRWRATGSRRPGHRRNRRGVA